MLSLLRSVRLFGLFDEAHGASRRQVCKPAASALRFRWRFENFELGDNAGGSATFHNATYRFVVTESLEIRALPSS